MTHVDLVTISLITPSEGDNMGRFSLGEGRYTIHIAITYEETVPDGYIKDSICRPGRKMQGRQNRASRI